MDTLKVIIEIDGLQLPSWNKIYSSPNWRKRKSIVDRIHQHVRLHLNTLEPIMFTNLVDITVECYYRTNVRPDSDNVCDKLVIDALRGAYIKDDNWKYVRYTTSASLLDRQFPRTVITIQEVVNSKENP